MRSILLNFRITVLRSYTFPGSYQFFRTFIIKLYFIFNINRFIYKFVISVLPSRYEYKIVIFSSFKISIYSIKKSLKGPVTTQIKMVNQEVLSLKCHRQTYIFTKKLQNLLSVLLMECLLRRHFYLFKRLTFLKNPVKKP